MKCYKVFSQVQTVLFLFAIIFFLNSGDICSANSPQIVPLENSLNTDSIANAFGKLTPDVAPEELYSLYNLFCLTHFGAETNSLVYKTFGEKFSFLHESFWHYFSEKSASIAWKTNLPAKSWIEYGTTQSYGLKTQIPERFFYLHLHYLKNLKPNTRYHFKLVCIDERGNKIESEDKTFETIDIHNVIKIPGDLGSPPYLLNQPNSVYLVTENIDADRTAFEIMADNITLDLGGNTITHGNQLINDLDHEKLEKSGVGIRRKNSVSKQTGIRILNGILRHGVAENNSEYYQAKNMVRPDSVRKARLAKNSSRGFSNIELRLCDNVEIAGVTTEYRWHQTWGMRFEDAYLNYNIHHNICLDKGTQMFNRHGDGTSRSIGFRGSAAGNLSQDTNNIQIHHNLIKRCRQNALHVAQKIYDNEIYIDSWVVNSFAIGPHQNSGEVYNNNIFLTGYYGCGILWATTNLNAHHNFIHMESISTMIERPNKGRRLIETWGEQDVLAGMRLTNYNKGGQKRKNLNYSDNVIFGRCRGDTEMRGTEFFSDYSIENLVFENNIVKIMAEDTLVRKAACVDTQGAFNDRTTHLPLYYKNCDLISNVCHVRFGDNYGQGSNHRFIDCKLVKIGNYPDYHTFKFDGHSSVFNHVLLDCEFIGGAKFDDVYWENTQSFSNYRIDWTLTLDVPRGADVVVRDKKGTITYKGIAGKKGVVSLPVTQCIIRPVEWEPAGNEKEVLEKSEHQTENFNPYTVTVKKEGVEQSKTLSIENPISLSFIFE